MTERTISPTAQLVGHRRRDQSRKGFVGDDQKGVLLVAIHRDVVRRAALANQFKLGEMRPELGMGVVELYITGGLENPRALVLGVARPEVGHQPGADLLGLADLDHLPAGIEHPICPRPVFRQTAHPKLERVEIGGSELQGEGGRHSRKVVEEGERIKLIQRIKGINAVQATGAEFNLLNPLNPLNPLLLLAPPTEHRPPRIDLMGHREPGPTDSAWLPLAAVDEEFQLKLPGSPVVVT